MAVKIRLRRMGAKKRPFYRVVVADTRAPRGGRFIEEIGIYNPLTEPVTVKVNPERVAYWVGTGAKPTDTVHRLFKAHGVYEAKPEVVEEAAAAEPVVAEVKAEETPAEEIAEEQPSAE